MEGFKHLEREGTDYIVKQYVSLQHIIVMIWALINRCDHQYKLSENRDYHADIFTSADVCCFYASQSFL